MRQSLYNAVDDGLRDRVEGIRRFIEDHKTRLLLEEVKEEFRAHGDYFQVIDENGEVIYRGAALAATRFAPLPTASPTALIDGELDGEPLRFLAETIRVDDHRFMIQAAAPLGALQQGSPRCRLAAGGGACRSRCSLPPVAATG